MSSRQAPLPSAADAPLLPRDDEQQHDGCDGGDGEAFPWLTAAGFGFVTVNSGVAAYRARADARAVAFVAFSFLDLSLLLYCLWLYERTRPESPRRGGLRVAVWVLTTALTLMFSYKVATVMPVAVAVLVWVMAVTTIAGGFSAFFCYGEK